MSLALEHTELELHAGFPIRGVGLATSRWASAEGLDGLSTPATCPMWALSSEFPSVRWAQMAQPPSDALVISASAWRAAPVDFARWDRAVASLAARPRWLVVQGDDAAELEQTAREIVTRYQRLAPRTNAHSAGETFRRVLRGHRAMHDLDKPLVSADYDHALDVWQWVLRLSPMAGLAVQLAALFHDIERLVSEAERRVEHTAADYQAFKNAHAAQGAAMAVEVLAACGVDRFTCATVAALIRDHELPHRAARGAQSGMLAAPAADANMRASAAMLADADVRADAGRVASTATLADADLAADAELLANADALSFFSLNSPGFADYYGPEHTRRKVRYSLGRMSADAIRRLAGVRLREDVARHLDEASRGQACERRDDVSRGEACALRDEASRGEACAPRDDVSPVEVPPLPSEAPPLPVEAPPLSGEVRA